MLTIFSIEYGSKTTFLISLRFTEMLLLYLARASMVLLMPSIMIFSLGLQNRLKKS